MISDDYSLLTLKVLNHTVEHVLSMAYFKHMFALSLHKQ